MERIVVQRIHLSWFPILRDLHWNGQLQIFLNKGYVALQLTDEEKKKWGLTKQDVTSIEEILQSQIDMGKSKLSKEVLLRTLSDSQVVIPNYQVENKALLETLQQETVEVTEKLLSFLTPMISPLQNQDFVELDKMLNQWMGKSIRNVYTTGAKLLNRELHKHSINIDIISILNFERLPIQVQAFLIVINFYNDKAPSKALIDLFRNLLLKKDDHVIRSIDFCIYRYWRNHAEIMYRLTETWIKSQNPVLIDWLIHGIEVPGKQNSRRALRFLKPIIDSEIKSEDISWLLSHVMGTIMSSTPYDCLNELVSWLEENPTTYLKKIIQEAIWNVVEDKFIMKNEQNDDFPDLQTALNSILIFWINHGTEEMRQIATNILDMYATHD